MLQTCAENNALHTFRILGHFTIIWDHTSEALTGHEIFNRTASQWVTQQHFRSHDNQRLAERQIDLAAQQMEEVSRSCTVGDNPVGVLKGVKVNK
jgi:hypothetical protein